MNETKIINENFFLIDSDNWQEVSTKFYGYGIDKNGGIVTRDYRRDSYDNITDDVPNGAWLFVERTDDEIIIRQDEAGSWGLYLFEADGYFALSNSFYMLADYISGRYPLSLNSQFALATMSHTYCAHSIDETLINEIRLLPRQYVLHINSANGVRFEKKDGMCIVPIDSLEGLSILDDWFYSWTALIRNLVSCTGNVKLDLSGGMDSRITFLLFAKSGIDFSKIQVRSIKDTLHTHSEDYVIANQIANKYDITLNNKGFSDNELSIKMKDIVEQSLYTKLGFHKQMYFNLFFNKDTVYHFTGGGGECLRDYWQGPADKFIMNRAAPFKEIKEQYEGIINIWKRSFSLMNDLYEIPVPEKEFLSRVYRESEQRSHFSKQNVEKFLSNELILAPLSDTRLACLSLGGKKCPDTKLLYALIYTRYCPELLDFKFDGGRSISSNTINYACQINRKFPLKYKMANSSNNTAITALRIHSMPEPGKQRIKIYDVLDLIKRIFESDYCKNTIAEVIPSGGKLYEEAKKYAETHEYFPLQQIYMVLAIVKAADAVKGSEKTLPKSMYDYFTDMLHENY